MSFILTPLATPRQLRNTPSSQDGIPPDLEADLRAFGAQLIQEAGTLAQLCALVLHPSGFVSLLPIFNS